MQNFNFFFFIALVGAGLLAAFPGALQDFMLVERVPVDPAIPAQLVVSARQAEAILSQSPDAARAIVGLYSSLGDLIQLPEFSSTSDVQEIIAGSIAAIKFSDAPQFADPERLGDALDDVLRASLGIGSGSPIPNRSLTATDRLQLIEAFSAIEFAVRQAAKK